MFISSKNIMITKIHYLHPNGLILYPIDELDIMAVLITLNSFSIQTENLLCKFHASGAAHLFCMNIDKLLKRTLKIAATVPISTETPCNMITVIILDLIVLR